MFLKADGVSPFRGYMGLTSSHKAASLFEYIPANRSCSEAGIGDFHCQEGKWKSVLKAKSERDFSTVPYQLIEKINMYLKQRSKKICQVLQVQNITLLARQEKFAESEPSTGHIRYIHTQFDTLDKGLGSVKFNALLSYDERVTGDVEFKVMYISQITRYKKYEPCVPFDIVAMFCVCNYSSTTSE